MMMIYLIKVSIRLQGWCGHLMDVVCTAVARYSFFGSLVACLLKIQIVSMTISYGRLFILLCFFKGK